MGLSGDVAAHRKDSGVDDVAGLAEMVLEDLPGGVVGQIVDVDALAHGYRPIRVAAAPAGPPSLGNPRSARPLRRRLQVKILTVLPVPYRKS